MTCWWTDKMWFLSLVNRQIYFINTKNQRNNEQKKKIVTVFGQGECSKINFFRWADRILYLPETKKREFY